VQLPSSTISGKVVFVTSIASQEDGNFSHPVNYGTGLAGADAYCRARANVGVGLGKLPAGTYKAFLSTSTVNEKDRIVDAPYLCPTGRRWRRVRPISRAAPFCTPSPWTTGQYGSRCRPDGNSLRRDGLWRRHRGCSVRHLGFERPLRRRASLACRTRRTGTGSIPWVRPTAALSIPCAASGSDNQRG
jgi:hypothetical protein